EFGTRLDGVILVVKRMQPMWDGGVDNNVDWD
ncbi:hypothetical protein A2U01_0095878, partial [Trifolium medium]|nr:hypothetical protein [Trifolium medium]